MVLLFEDIQVDKLAVLLVIKGNHPGRVFADDRERPREQHEAASWASREPLVDSLTWGSRRGLPGSWQSYRNGEIR
jgi:hypothetical protein